VEQWLLGSLARTLRRLWTGQRCRSASGHSSLMATMSPGAARDEAMSEIEPVFCSLALTQTDAEQDTLAIERVAPGDENALFWTVRARRQIDRVEHEAQQLDIGEALCPKRPIAVAQHRADARHGSPADVAQTVFSGEALDVTVREARMYALMTSASSGLVRTTERQLGMTVLTKQVRLSRTCGTAIARGPSAVAIWRARWPLRNPRASGVR